MTAETPTLAWARVASPVGELTLVASESGLVRLAFETENTARILARVQEQLGATRIVDCSPFLSEQNSFRAQCAVLNQAHAQMDEYFGGTRQGFDVPLDMALPSGFRLEVIHAIQQIPFGQVRSYADVAAMTGHAGAARAVGTACRMNPLPLVVPCHRVIKADGSIGGYTPGLNIKRRLLALEGVDL